MTQSGSGLAEGRRPRAGVAFFSNKDVTRELEFGTDRDDL